MERRKSGISRELLIHPGETIADILDDRGITQSELALRMGVTPVYVSNVINGKKDISAKFAMKLEYALGVKKSFWLNLQANYDAELLELNELETISEEEIAARDHLNSVVKFLRSRELIPAREGKKESIISLRSFFNMSDLSNLPKLCDVGAFRMSRSIAADPFVLGAWIRISQLLCEKRSLDSRFDKHQISELVNGLKEIMMQNSSSVQSDLECILGKYGIDFIVMQHFAGAPVHGYVSSKRDGSYLMIVTIRRANADEFWFSLFHELGHIINGDVDLNSNFIDDGNDSDTEMAANKFAASALLEDKAYEQFVNRGIFTLIEIQKFADSQNVMPYIVIGRLRREKKLECNQYSSQMLRYKWAL